MALTAIQQMPMIPICYTRTPMRIAGFVQGLTGARLVWTCYIGGTLTCYVKLNWWGFVRSYLMSKTWQKHADAFAETHVRLVYGWRRRRHS